MTRWWRAWVALCDRREPATQLAVVRIALAGVLLVDLLDVRRAGLVDLLWSPPPAGCALPYDGWLGAHGLWWLAVTSLAAIAAGAATRVACVVFVLVSAQLSHLAPGSESALDVLARIAFAILALSRCNARWSIDAIVWRRLGRPIPAEVPAWPRYLLLLQLVWVYFSGGLNKSSGNWGPFGGFSALAYALADPHAARFDPSWVAAIYPLTQLATVATMAFELAAPLYLGWLYCAATRERPGRLRRLCNRLRLRWIWLGLGVAFELGIAIGLRLGGFPFGMLALYPVLLLPGDVLPRRLHSLARSQG